MRTFEFQIFMFISATFQIIKFAWCSFIQSKTKRKKYSQYKFRSICLLSSNWYLFRI